MAGSVNKVILVGNLGRDPEIRSIEGDRRVAKFSVATSERWRDRNSGESRERTEWHNIVVYNEALIKRIEDFLRKGSSVYLEGQLETRKWTDQQGAEKYTTEVVLRPYQGELVMLGGRPSGSPEEASPRGGSRSHPPVGRDDTGSREGTDAVARNAGGGFTGEDADRSRNHASPDPGDQSFSGSFDMGQDDEIPF